GGEGREGRGGGARPWGKAVVGARGGGRRGKGPAPRAAGEGGRRTLRVERDELIVVLQPASHRLALAPAVLERLGERGLDWMLAHEGLQLVDEVVDRQRRRRAFEGAGLAEGRGVRRGS